MSSSIMIFLGLVTVFFAIYLDHGKCLFLLISGFCNDVICRKSFFFIMGWHCYGDLKASGSKETFWKCP